MKSITTQIERLRYWQGQTLLSRDLNDQLANDASLRWWHNRAIHDAWGVVSGLSPRIEGEEIFVSAGLAYDCHGRELVLTDSSGLALPPLEEGQVVELVLRATATSPMPRLPVELQWREPAVVLDPRIGVPLGRLSLDDGAFTLHESGRQRSTQAIARPRLGNGATVPGRTDWRKWQITTGSRIPVHGVEVQVDTTAAGFERTPCYFASLQGDAFALLGQISVFVPLTRIVNATPASFIFSLWLPFAQDRASMSAARLFSVVAVPQSLGTLEYARRELSVCWLGVECGGVAKIEVKHGIT